MSCGVCADWRLFRLQEAERDELVQAKDRELAQALEASGILQQQNQELRRQVSIWYDVIRLMSNSTRTDMHVACGQEQSSRREVGDVEQRLRSSEALVADFQKSLQQRDLELETLRAKVTTHSE